MIRCECVNAADQLIQAPVERTVVLQQPAQSFVDDIQFAPVNGQLPKPYFDELGKFSCSDHGLLDVLQHAGL